MSGGSVIHARYVDKGMDRSNFENRGKHGRSHIRGKSKFELMTLLFGCALYKIQVKEAVERWWN